MLKWSGPRPDDLTAKVELPDVHLTFRIVPARYGGGFTVTVTDGWRHALVATGNSMKVSKRRAEDELAAIRDGDIDDAQLYAHEGDF